jgi:4-hydroxy-3-polyprenylbenzoate decarboxylase
MRLIVTMTGATGAVYGIRILKALQHLGVERHSILSRRAEVTIVKETGLSVSAVCAMASAVHAPDNQGATTSSGSFHHEGVVIAPCSMKTPAGLRSGYADGLIGRAADVSLKERRRLLGTRDAAEWYSS